ncbi:MAG: hypothetical protein ACK56I_07475, partial [bacterium]
YQALELILQTINFRKKESTYCLKTNQQERESLCWEEGSHSQILRLEDLKLLDQEATDSNQTLAITMN